MGSEMCIRDRHSEGRRTDSASCTDCNAGTYWTAQEEIPIYTGSKGYFIESEWSGSDEGNTGHRSAALLIVSKGKAAA